MGSALFFVSFLLKNGLVFAVLHEDPSMLLRPSSLWSRGSQRPLWPRAEGMCCLRSGCAGEGKRVWWAPWEHLIGCSLTSLHYGACRRCSLISLLNYELGSGSLCSCSWLVIPTALFPHLLIKPGAPSCNKHFKHFF